MDDLIDDLTRAARRCDRAKRTFMTGEFASIRDRLLKEVAVVHRAWSGSPIGFHSRVYLEGLRPAAPDERWDAEWGALEAMGSTTHGPWAIHDAEVVKEVILERAAVPAARTLR